MEEIKLTVITKEFGRLFQRVFVAGKMEYCKFLWDENNSSLGFTRFVTRVYFSSMNQALQK